MRWLSKNWRIINFVLSCLIFIGFFWVYLRSHPIVEAPICIHQDRTLMPYEKLAPQYEVYGYPDGLWRIRYKVFGKDGWKYEGVAYRSKQDAEKVVEASRKKGEENYKVAEALLKKVVDPLDEGK